jgi:hypothetical protein
MFNTQSRKRASTSSVVISGFDPNRRAVIVDPIENLDVEAELNERGATRAHIVRIKEQDFSFHSLQHVWPP